MSKASRAERWATLCQQARSAADSAAKGRGQEARKAIYQVAQTFTDLPRPETDAAYVQRFNQGICITSVINTIANADSVRPLESSSGQNFLDKAIRICANEGSG
jgi:hypothetical protein